ncbi:uncharacterized protein LOC110694123 isoform X1 [Chenopodium quinoa]|uniref:NHL repeat-containing protein n=1 Tax=Chenopodium quinoa TaxID=63459 RepID=A0A803LJ55_CHEQI|nr:uncharacterized protein LOC110694123 isoform X1 [Chenopodium quinoa]
MSLLPHLVIFFTLINLLIFHGLSEVIYEDGYTVTTVFDGNKLKINPYSVASRPGFHDLLLDSSNSVFYTLSLPLSQESLVKRFSGNGPNGDQKYTDGDASSAMFNKPRSFAMDFKGNVYVADRSNHVVRKISPSGVSTIAGSSTKPGRADGPGEDATFSPDFELSFVPEMCALLIMDHGNKLIRQINLKQEDCVHSRAGSLGSTTIWVAALAFSCFFGLLVGFAVRPYIIRTEVFKRLNSSKSWRSYRMNLGRQTLMHCFGTRSVLASPAIRFLKQLIMPFISLLSLMLSFIVNRFYPSSSSSIVCKEYVSLLDSDNLGNSECLLSRKYADQLKCLTTFDGDSGSSNMFNGILKNKNVVETDDRCHGKIDNLIKANIESFNVDAPAVLEETFLGVSTVVRRR